ncbi:MAG: discoidin domain-containing protein, partial [Chlorobiales bacterium]|nr:discoidin domain-containing protein [Chlorobiales bacterium]
RFIRVLPFNRAFWSGHTQRYVLPVPCRISPSDRIDFTANVALGGRASASLGGKQASRLIDGDLATSWSCESAGKGDWIEIELLKPARVGAIRIVQDRFHGEFFQRFRISTRSDTNPKTPAEPFDRQLPAPFRHVMANEKDVNNERPSERWVTYAASPRLTRVIRIEALDGGRADLSEIRVFAER